MITKYVTGYTADKIKQVEVIRETEAFVYLPGYQGGKERREAKVSKYDQYHDSWNEAHQYLTGKAQEEVDAIRRRLEQAKGKLGNIKGLKNPEAKE